MSAPSSPSPSQAPGSRPYVRAWLPSVLWMLVIFALSSRSTLPGPKGVPGELQSIVGHFVFYGVLGLCFEYAFLTLGYRRFRAGILAVALAFAYGTVDEFHQAFVPGRNSDPFDVWVDTVGAAVFVYGLRWARREWRREEARAAAPEPPPARARKRRRAHRR